MTQPKYNDNHKKIFSLLRNKYLDALLYWKMILNIIKIIIWFKLVNF